MTKVNKINSTQKRYRECGVYFRQRKDGYFAATIFVPYKDDPQRPKKRYDLSANSEQNMRKKIRDFTELTRKVDVNLLYTGEFQNYALEWLKMKKEKAIRRGKSGGYIRLEFTLTHYLIPHFMNKKLLDITKEELQIFVNEFGKNYSESSTKKLLTPIKEIFKYAYENKHISSNPALLLHGLNKSNYGIKTKTTFSLSREQQDQFEKICASKCDNGNYKYHLGYIYIFLLNTGLRRGEMLALKWTDIDFEKKRVNINKSIVMRKGDKKYDKTRNIEVIETTKTKNGIRYVPLNKKALHALYCLREMHPNSEWVTSTKEGKRVGLSNLNSNLINLLKVNNMPVFELHTLRHTFATRLFYSGVQVDVIAKLMGHSSVKTTYRYIHTDNTELHKYMDNAKLYNSKVDIA